MTLVSDIDFFGGDATDDECSESRSQGGDASSGIPSRSTDLEPASDARPRAAICLGQESWSLPCTPDPSPLLPVTVKWSALKSTDPC